MTADTGSHTEVDFDPHGPEMPFGAHEKFAELRGKCPVAHTDAHDGFWVASTYDEVVAAARDEDTFSSENNLANRQGIMIPPLPARAGIIETAPPRFAGLRKAFVPWYTPGAARSQRDDIERIAAYSIDQFIESGRGDLTHDVTAPIPALWTMQFLGFPATDTEWMADLFHRQGFTPPNTPERDRMDEDMGKLGILLNERAAARRANPTDDVMSRLAAVELDGVPLPIEEVVENAWLILAGGIDTTTTLLSNTFLHLNDKPELRERLMVEPKLLDTAFDEYLRYYSPQQGLARTVTNACTFAGQELKENDRLWLSWASANLDESVFDDPESVELTRSPNRHVAFGIGAHRCLGANFAKVLWQTVVRSVLTRLPDYKLDTAAMIRNEDVGVSNGWVSMPMTFTPGSQIGAQLP